MEICHYHGSITKRCLDLTLCFVLSPVVLLTIPVLFFFHLVRDRESVFYIDDRVGMLGDVFRIYKFRSVMRHCDTSHNPSRLYKVIRSLHIDETPQIINVIKGEMSFIGPRPYLGDECRLIENQIENFRDRHSIRPGITGLAQIKYRHDNSISVSQGKFNDDMTYLSEASLVMDLKILLITLLHVSKGGGA